jgi:hypothetical protein
MPVKRKKRKINVPETILYEIKIEEWWVECRFGTSNEASRLLNLGKYNERSSLILSGPILSPELKIANSAEIRLLEKPSLNDHWNQIPSNLPEESFGAMTVTYDNVLMVFLDVPTRIFNFVSLAASSNKLNYATIWGTKLRYRQGGVSTIHFRTNYETE